jgi:hypothetical protein
MIIQPHKAPLQRKWYSGELTGPPKHQRPLSFTVTFRASDDEPWRWSNEQFSISDGHVIYPMVGELADDLAHYIAGLPAYLQISRESSDAPDTLLWSLAGSVDAASGNMSGRSNLHLGKPTTFSQWFALVRLWSPWLAPRQGRGDFRPDKETILAAFRRDDGTHLVVLALSGVDHVLTTLHHDGHGSMTINSRNDAEREGEVRLIAAVGGNVESAMAAAAYHARRIVQRYDVASGGIDTKLKALQGGFRAEWLESWYDGLAYCTWNGLGQQLHEKKIFDALDSLHTHGINITNLIIDDNWVRPLLLPLCHFTDLCSNPLTMKVETSSLMLGWNSKPAKPASREDWKPL